MTDTQVKFKPMLASDADMGILRFPLYVSPKIDGLRCTVHDGLAMSRSMKPLPNKWLQEEIGATTLINDQFVPFDGELVVGPPNAPDVYRKSTSHIMSHDKVGFDWRFYVFDLHGYPEWDYAARIGRLAVWHSLLPPNMVHLLETKLIYNQAELDAYEVECLEQGFEGVMTRDPNGLYKQGRATARGQELLKVKRSSDMEAEVIGWHEQMHNTNEAKTNEIGRTQRSSAKEGLVGNGTLGALKVRGLNGPFAGVEFDVGTGFDDADRARLWATRHDLVKRRVVMKVGYFLHGSKDKPRHPTWLGERSLDDMGD